LSATNGPKQLQQCPCTEARLLDHLIRTGEQAWGDRDPERLRGVEIDQQLKTRRSFGGYVRRVRAFQNFVYQARLAVIDIGQTRAIGHEATGESEISETIDRGQASAFSTRSQLPTKADKQGSGAHVQTLQVTRGPRGWSRRRD